MKRFLLTLAILLATSQVAQAEPAKEATIKEMMEVLHMRQVLDTSRAQALKIMNQSIQQAVGDKTLNNRQQQAVDRYKSRFTALAEDMLSWSDMERMTVRIYQDALTEDELQGILAFYKTPAGQALVIKLPKVMQSLMTEMQKMTQSNTKRIVGITEDFAKEMKAASQ